MKQYEVAIIYDENGKVIGALKCKLVGEKEYKELIAETKKTLDVIKNREEVINGNMEFFNNEIARLEKEINILKGEEE